MESNEKCLYCKEIIYPGLNFQDDCAKSLASNTDKASVGLPLTAKAKGEFAGYKTRSYSQYDSSGNYMGEKEVRYKSYYKSSNKLVDKSELLSIKNKSLKGPLCYDCRTEFLEQVLDVFKGFKTKGKKSAIESSKIKIKKRFIKLKQNWENKI